MDEEPPPHPPAGGVVGQTELSSLENDLEQPPETPAPTAGDLNEDDEHSILDLDDDVEEDDDEPPENEAAIKDEDETPKDDDDKKDKDSNSEMGFGPFD